MTYAPRGKCDRSRLSSLQVAQAWENDFWTLITGTKLDFLRLHVSPLLRFAAGVDVAAETFTHKVERLKLQILQSTPSPQLLQSIAEDVSLLPDIAERVRSSPSAKLALSTDLAKATPAQLTQIMRDLASEMKNRRERPSALLKIDLPDFIATHGYISVGEGGHQILIEEYRRRVDARVLEITEKHPALVALRAGREVTDDQLVDLERTLHRELGRDDIQLSSRNTPSPMACVWTISLLSSDICWLSTPSPIILTSCNVVSSSTFMPTITMRTRYASFGPFRKFFLQNEPWSRQTCTIRR